MTQTLADILCSQQDFPCMQPCSRTSDTAGQDNGLSCPDRLEHYTNCMGHLVDSISRLGRREGQGASNATSQPIAHNCRR